MCECVFMSLYCACECVYVYVYCVCVCVLCVCVCVCVCCAQCLLYLHHYLVRPNNQLFWSMTKLLYEQDSIESFL